MLTYNWHTNKIKMNMHECMNTVIQRELGLWNFALLVSTSICARIYVPDAIYMQLAHFIFVSMCMQLRFVECTNIRGNCTSYSRIHLFNVNS